MDHDQMIAVIQAHKEGKRIEFKAHLHDHAWLDAKNPEWNFGNFDYRVKPEPREWWEVERNDRINGPWFLRFKTFQDAQENRLAGDKIVHVREVID